MVIILCFAWNLSAADCAPQAAVYRRLCFTRVAGSENQFANRASGVSKADVRYDFKLFGVSWADAKWAELAKRHFGCAPTRSASDAAAFANCVLDCNFVIYRQFFCHRSCFAYTKPDQEKLHSFSHKQNCSFIILSQTFKFVYKNFTFLKKSCIIEL